MKRTPRKIALIVALLFMLAFASSLLLASLCVGHDCAGLDYPVCLQMNAMSTLMRSMLLLAAAFLAAACARMRLACGKTRLFSARPRTLVCLKVKLSD